MKRTSLFTFLFLFSASTLFPFQERVDETLRDALKSVKEKYAPDRRTAVFDVLLERKNTSLIVRGEVDNTVVKGEALNALRASFTGEMIDSILVLPDPRLGEKFFGIVILSVGNVRSKPGNAEELATQVLMGMVVKLLKKEGGYYYVQSSDRYLGWLDDDAIQVTDRVHVDAWASAPKVIATGLFGMVREKPDVNSLPVCDLVVGGILKSTGSAGSWFGVELADGRTGYVERSFVEEYDAWKASRKLNGEHVERSAKMLVGVPYLWGGTSVKGMDCSGFTKTVFRMNGMELNRDANQQAVMGEEVNTGDNFQNLRKGDLLFFGRKAAGDKP
ncbi:MAG TPA: NlpC/P60 family protein, partial [Bacteroidota bacterium]|nr:NlpC/P60 family protein [Bacteroidota bacterium]